MLVRHLVRVVTLIQRIEEKNVDLISTIFNVIEDTSLQDCNSYSG